MRFEPIAIVGQGCVFPGGLNPAELWTTIAQGRDVLGAPPQRYWDVSPDRIVRDGIDEPSFDHSWSDRGGYVRGFEGAFDSNGYLLDADSLQSLDSLYLWTLYAARQAIQSAGWQVGEVPGRVGVVLGNLSYPTHTMSKLAARVWRADNASDQTEIDWRNRFNSGLPAHLVARALGLTAGAFCLDAACASSLYAIKLACDRLHDGTADVMLAGGVNRADDLFLHIGFCALQALSRSGASRPFDQHADGLVPAEGAGFVVLRRLHDALASGEKILGLVRAVGIGNDGRDSSMLTPSREGQERAMRSAYAMAGLDPQDISMIECHATGTPLGDLTELKSMARIFSDGAGVPIGSLKSNLGHSITASGIAGVIKVLAAMRAQLRPPTLHVEDPLPFLKGSPFRLLTSAEPWASSTPRRAAVNNFGFGGNNAHLIVEEWVPSAASTVAGWTRPVNRGSADSDVAVVGLSIVAGDGYQTAQVAEHLGAGRTISTREADGVVRARLSTLSLDLTQIHFPPNDLKNALPQQIALLGAALNIAETIEALPADSTSVLIGMGCDAEVARWGMRWRLADAIDDAGELARTRDGVVPGLVASTVVGTMPNIVANRINSQFDLRGPSFTVSREQLSGTTALELAARALRHGDVDAAVVGAVDLSCEPVHEAAARIGLTAAEQIPGDAAVIMVLKRAEDARRDNDTIYALLPARIADTPRATGQPLRIGTAPGSFDVTPLLGHPHAASGLLQLSAGILFGFLGIDTDGSSSPPGQRQVVVTLDGLAGEHQELTLLTPAGADLGCAAQQQNLVRQLALARGDTGKARLLQFPAHMPPVRLPAALRPAVAQPAAQPDAPTVLPRPPAIAPILDPVLATASHRADNGAHRAIQPTPPDASALPVPTVKRTPTGLRLDKDGLRVHASGRISHIYGPAFAIQDEYPRQTRMPEPPLLLADRLLGIDAAPGKLGTGTLWTETDVSADAWWLHRGRMPAGIMIESGQADLMLISWMGADFANKGERVYRLLGCELTFLGGLPEIDDTLRFDIHVDGHANQGDIRLFFFHYDCTIDGTERLAVRNGQAGFFSDEELAASGGILWRPENDTVTGRLDSPPCPTSRQSLSTSDLKALAAGSIWPTMGEGFERAASHTRTPTTAGGRMLIIDEVTQIDFSGGPWGRGYLRAVQHVTPQTWFFQGHFKNDPCMPGTLMFEGTLQAMATYMTAAGMTLACDGWRFEPAPFETYKLKCRGQVTPGSGEVVYEVFVRELVSGPDPTLFADVLCTVDGLAAFHCARLGLKLSPGWPMDEGLHELDTHAEPKPVAAVHGFSFDYKSLMACALGKPSHAFGELYKRFDTTRNVARLPSPPYHFMSRITDVVGESGVMKSGVTLVAEYDVPPDAWYFTANGCTSMPSAVLMEVCLQPCGWLASYIGCPLSTDTDLFFRNLDGTGSQHQEVTPSSGILRTEVRLKNVAKVADTIIVSFAVQAFAGESLVYSAETVFGYFPGPALDQQAGLPTSDTEREQFAEPSAAPEVDLTTRPRKFFDAGAKLPGPMLLMIDRVTGRWPAGGHAGLGRWRAVKDVDPAEWFFKAHFFKDPVQPGSLGIESMINLLQFAMLDLGLGHEAGPNAHFEPVAIDQSMTWRYRGQVRPHNKLITTQLEITKIERSDAGVLALADASLWVDGLRIYSATGLGVRINRNPPGQPATEPGSVAAEPGMTTVETVVDPALDTWINDHRPTYNAPALPLMSVVDLFARAAQHAADRAVVIAVNNVTLSRWLVVDQPMRLRTQVEPSAPGTYDARLQVWRDAANPRLSRWEPIASGTVSTAPDYPQGPPPPNPLRATAPLADPYYSGAVFHGPAFQSLDATGRIGRDGASGTLTVDRCSVPRGAVHPGILDGGLHIVPHTAISVWTGHTDAAQCSTTDSMVGFPHHIAWVRFYRDAPEHGKVAVEARFAGFENSAPQFPMIDLRYDVAGRPWAQIRVVEVLLPKTQLGQADGVTRRAFLRERRPVPGLTLGDRRGPGDIELDTDLVTQANWFPGTIQALYSCDTAGAALGAEVAIKEAVASAADGAIHPSQVRLRDGRVSCPALPLEDVQVTVEHARPHTVRARAALRCDWEPVRASLREQAGRPQGSLGDLLLWALLSRYVRHVVLEDPDAIRELKGRSVLLLANHQVQVESILATAIASWLTDTTVVTVSNAKHVNRWVGKVSRVLGGGEETGMRNIHYFDQSNPYHFFEILNRAKQDIAERGSSMMVHAPGTRQRSSTERVAMVTSTLLDTALQLSLPIVPVHFAGGLPEQPLNHKLEVPYRHATQDYIFGSPIMPDELAALPYVQRRTRVLNAINALAPITDAPHQPNTAAEARITAATAGLAPLDSIWAAIEDALDALPVDWRNSPGSQDWPRIAGRHAPRHMALAQASRGGHVATVSQGQREVR
jgi:3-oxoacyl-(acyl-carrier-protein) synthase/3-hydroxymyristoyl/3-hydroxydecanoyl-(acyl carrier protein) dehydratase